MKRWKIAALTFIVTAVLCSLALLVISGVSGVGGDRLELWYVEGDCSEARLERLKARYNIRFLSGRQMLSLRSFESEDELAAAFEEGRPDLLLCDSAKTADLQERGLLSEASLSTEEYPEAVIKATGEAGGSFLPLGSRLSLLLLSEAKCAQAGTETDFATLESFAEGCKAYTESTGEAFFSACSYADFMDAAMCSLGGSFTGDIRADAGDASFAYVYNLLADCGYAGSLLALGDGAAKAVAEGSLACACVRSDKLVSLGGEGLTVCALPLPEKGERKYPAELMGLAVTAEGERAVSEASFFLSWLRENGRADSLALASALIPISPKEGSSDGYWAPRLVELSSGCELCYERREADREDFDLSFGAALDLLR